MEDPGQRGGEEPVGRLVEAGGGPDEQELAQRPRVEGEGDLGGNGLAARSPGRSAEPAAGTRRRGAPAATRAASSSQAAASNDQSMRRPARRASSSRAVGGSTLAAVRTWASGLRSLPTPIRPSAQAWSGRRAAPGERVEDDVAGARVAGDEGVGEGRREAGQVRAHRVVGVAPQARPVLPVGLDARGREGERTGAAAGPGPGRARPRGTSGRPRAGAAGDRDRKARPWGQPGLAACAAGSAGDATSADGASRVRARASRLDRPRGLPPSRVARLPGRAGAEHSTGPRRAPCGASGASPRRYDCGAFGTGCSRGPNEQPRRTRDLPHDHSRSVLRRAS